MKRGDLVIAAERGRLTGKPRPWLVVQSDAFNETHASVTLALITSHATGQALFRVAIDPVAQTGLDDPSEIWCDKLFTVSRGSVTEVIGRASQPTLDLVDAALRRWLNL